MAFDFNTVDGESKQLVVNTAKAAAVALANFWDALREVEQEHDVAFDGTVSMIEDLASNCDAPATVADLDDEGVIEALNSLDEEE